MTTREPSGLDSVHDSTTSDSDATIDGLDGDDAIDRLFGSLPHVRVSRLSDGD